MELQDGILPIGPGGIREGVRRRGVLKMEKTVQNSRKSAACDGFIRTERTIVISLNDPIFPGPLIDGGLRPVSVRIRKCVGRHDGAAHRQSRRCQPLSKMPLHSCSFLSKPVESMPKKRHGPYGPWCYVALRHIIAKPETWVNILSEISPGKLCKVSESVPSLSPEKAPGFTYALFPSCNAQTGMVAWS